MKATSDRVLTAIFCDDIRHEVGNKMSFMGCYQDELFVPSAPIALSKLCIYVTLISPIERPMRSLVFKILQGDDKELARIEISDEALQNTKPVAEGSATRAGLNAAMVFSTFLILVFERLRRCRSSLVFQRMGRPRRFIPFSAAPAKWHPSGQVPQRVPEPAPKVPLSTKAQKGQDGLAQPWS